jgi:hypothetical protein
LNPLLPVLLLASLAGLLVARRGAGLAWCLAGLAATALLAPALVIPDGIPSPAARLAAHPPWQMEADPEAGNPHLQDVTYQVQPWLLFLRDELRGGRLPLWNPFVYAGAPYWSNGSSAPLFPLHLLFVVLPEQAGWLLLPWLRVVIGALGLWLLARELGLSRAAAAFAAVAFPLSGMQVGFLLFPMGNALALAPWVLWTVERLAGGRGGWPPLAAAAGLQLLAGHPETAVHTAMLSGLYLLVRGIGEGVGRRRAWLSWFAGWTAGGALAAVQLLPLTFRLLVSSRWQAHTAAEPPPLDVLLVQPLRLLLPELFGNPALGTWWGPFNWPSTAVYVGAATLPLAAAGLAAAWRPGRRVDRRWLAVAVVLAFSFAAAYQAPGVRHLLAALPVAGRALHHRLLFGIDLSLALLAGAGLDRWRAGRGRGVAAGAGAVLVLLAVAWWRFRAEWEAHGLLLLEARWTLWLAAVAVLLAAGLAAPRTWRRRLALLLPVIVAADLVAAHGRFNPGLPLSDLYPATGAVEYLAGRPGRLVAPGQVLRPNAAMVYRLHDVRGDDSVKSARYEALFRDAFGAGHPTYFTPLTRWDAVWLDRLAVRWLITGPGSESPVAPAALVYDGPDARVWRRPGSLPPVRWEGAPPGCTAATADRRPGRWTIDWRCGQAARLVVAESWDPGWRARTAAGRPLRAEVVEQVLVGVRLGPGEGRVVLSYRPVGLEIGGALSLAGLVVLLAGVWHGRRRRRGGRPAGGAPAAGSGGDPPPQPAAPCYDLLSSARPSARRTRRQR